MNSEQLINLKTELTLKMLIKTRRTIDDYKENPFFEKDAVISGVDIIDTDSYKNGTDFVKSEIENIALSSRTKTQGSHSKTLSLSLKGISGFYKNNYVEENKEIF